MKGRVFAFTIVIMTSDEWGWADALARSSKVAGLPEEELR